MSDLITASGITSYPKQDIVDYFLKPLLTGDDIRTQITIRDGIKGSELLDFFGALSKITKTDSGSGFAATGNISYTQKTLTVKHLKGEIEQNGKAFRDTVKGYLLASGYKEDDIFQSDVLARIYLKVIADAIRRDLVRQMWFASLQAETYSSGVRTGTANEDYNVYDGFWTLLLNDLRDGTLPTSQRVSIAPTTPAVAQSQRETLASTTSGTVTLTISGMAYSVPYSTSVAATVTNFYNTHLAALKARNIKLTNPSSSVLQFDAYHAGEGFTIEETSGGASGSWTSSAVTANVQSSSAMATDTALGVFQEMYDAATPELLELESTQDIAFYVTRSLYANYRNSLQKLNGSEAAFTMLVNGRSTLSWNGIPVILRPEWDLYINTDLAGIYPHRALLTTPKNLVLGCDGSADDSMVETWYNPDLQMRRARVKYKAGTQYIHEKYIVLGLG
jgi:hypothetical protein